MRCIIVDNDRAAREHIKMYIKDMLVTQLIGEFEDVSSARDFLHSHGNDVDVMFLAIELPGTSGMDLLKSLDNYPMIIITTVNPHYAVESYEYAVADYLLKPITRERFVQAIAKVERYLKLTEIYENIKYVGTSYMFIKSDRKFIKVDFDEIMYIEGLKDYVIVHTADNQYVTCINIKGILSKLPKTSFMRVSKSFIVNIRHIDTIDNFTIDIKGKQIAIGQIYREDFFNFISQAISNR